MWYRASFLSLVDLTHHVFSLVVEKSSVHNWCLVSLFNIATLVSPPVTFPQDLVMSQYTRTLDPWETCMYFAWTAPAVQYICMCID